MLALLVMSPPGDIVMKRGWATVGDSSNKTTPFPSEQDQNRRNVVIKNYMFLPLPPYHSLEGKAHAAATFFMARLLSQYGVQVYLQRLHPIQQGSNIYRDRDRPSVYACLITDQIYHIWIQVVRGILRISADKVLLALDASKSEEEERRDPDVPLTHVSQTVKPDGLL
jgi:hypothetical protein